VANLITYCCAVMIYGNKTVNVKVINRFTVSDNPLSVNIFTLNTI
jgi:hypothetical protein